VIWAVFFAYSLAIGQPHRRRHAKPVCGLPCPGEAVG
jgi:hypothetical protein